MNRRLLLLSNSQTFGREYLDHAAGELTDFLGDVREVVFVPFALKDRRGYGATVGGRLEPLGISTATLSDDPAGLRALESAALLRTACWMAHCEYWIVPEPLIDVFRSAPFEAITAPMTVFTPVPVENAPCVMMMPWKV